MIKPKIYLDTSVISHLEAEDAPEKRADTINLWHQLIKDNYEVIISPVVYEELGRCKKELEEKFIDWLSQINTTFVPETEETAALTEAYLQTNVLTPKSENDCRHIAIASVYGCKYILSWNMKHFVKVKTIEMVQEVNAKLGIAKPLIITPSIFIEGDEQNE